MPIYHCFYVGFDNKVVETRSMKSPSATAMLEEAERLLGSNSTVAGIEIWKGGRLDRKVWLKRSARIEGEFTDAGPESPTPPIMWTSSNGLAIG